MPTASSRELDDSRRSGTTGNVGARLKNEVRSCRSGASDFGRLQAFGCAVRCRFHLGARSTVRTMSELVAVGALLVALSSFAFGRRDFGREHAANVYALSIEWRVGDADAFTKVRIRNGGPPRSSPSVSRCTTGVGVVICGGYEPTRWWSGTRFVGRAFAIILPSSEGELAELPAPTTTRGADVPPVILTFTDGNGRRWIRWPDGRLSRRLLR